MSFANILASIAPLPANSYTFDFNTYAGSEGYGSSQSQTVDLRTYFSSGQLPDGSTIRIGAQIAGSWVFNSPYYWNLTVGSTSQSSTTPYAYRKQQYFYVKIVGTLITAYSYYAGDSTSGQTCQSSVIYLAIP